MKFTKLTGRGGPSIALDLVLQERVSNQLCLKLAYQLFKAY